MNKIKIPSKFINILSELPEQGMGYQIVNIKLKDGEILSNRHILNSTYLILLSKEKIKESDIEEIEPTKK